jgi:hypothetical protein
VLGCVAERAARLLGLSAEEIAALEKKGVVSARLSTARCRGGSRLPD